MNGTEREIDAPIGRRSSPRLGGALPASGIAWTGPREFIVREEFPGAFRWVMVSGDDQRLQLARSSSLFPSVDACRLEVRQLDPQAQVSIDEKGQVKGF